MRGIGDIAKPHVERIHDKLGLIPGDLALSRFEDKLSRSWPECHNRDEAAFRVMTAFHRLMASGAEQIDAALVLVDVGPNLGAINRAALIASEQVALPLAPDLFSLQGLKNLGPTLREWRQIWKELLIKAPQDLSLPSGRMEPVGYIVMQHANRESRPVKAYLRWMNRIPSVYREVVLSESINMALPAVQEDPYCLGLLKHYRSLMPLAMEAGKPMFFLKSADGAIGSHIEAVKSCYDDFRVLARHIANRAGLALD